MKQIKSLSAEESKSFRKEVRKTSNHAALGSLLYTVVSSAAAIGFLVVMVVLSGRVEQFLSEPYDKFLATLPFVDTLDIIAPLCGLAAVFLCFAKQGTHKQLFVKRNSMTLPILCGLICVMCLFDSVGVTFTMVTEMNLNCFGYSMAEGAELASGMGLSIVALITTCLVGPVIEELVFRGFLLRRMERYGKVTAIVVSSVLFGLMHQNLPQIMPAMMIGLVWGYVATEYSLGWSIVLHIFENLVRCTLLNNLLDGFNDQLQIVIRISMMVVTAIIALVIIIHNRKSVMAWIRSNPCEKSVVAWSLTSGGVVMVIAYYMVCTIRNLV